MSVDVRIGAIPSGWRNNPGEMQQIAFASRCSRIDVRYRRERSGRWTVAAGEVAAEAGIDHIDGDSIDLSIDGARRTYRIVASGRTCGVHSVLGLSDFARLSRFPTHASEEIHGGCQAPMPGKVLEVRVVAGDRVHRGDLLVVLEAMKMEHQIVAATDARVAEVRVEVGQQVDAGQVLVVLEDDAAAQSFSSAS